jgi:hypothetical protein
MRNNCGSVKMPAQGLQSLQNACASLLRQNPGPAVTAINNFYVNSLPPTSLLSGCSDSTRKTTGRLPARSPAARVHARMAMSPGAVDAHSTPQRIIAVRSKCFWCQRQNQLRKSRRLITPIGNRIAVVRFWKKELTGACVIDKSSVRSFFHHISTTQFE